MGVLRFFSVCIVILLTSMSVFGSTISAYLELVLTEDGVLIDGFEDVTLELYGPDGDLRWSETHEDVVFYQGVCSFEFGTITELDTIWFYDSGIQLYVTIDDETIELPLYSTPFTMFAHAADIVNIIYMDGVFHTDTVNERIGINLDIPTPSVRLEVNGAIRVADSDTTQVGSIRWGSNGRLEGLHNSEWQWLDVSESDEFETRWTLSDDSYSVYVTEYNILINTENMVDLLTVVGDVYIEDQLIISGDLIISDNLVIGGTYGVSNNGVIIARDITIDDENYMNFTDGLYVSGTFYGSAEGVENISLDSLMDSSISGQEIADFAILPNHFANFTIENDAIVDSVINSDHLSASFQLTNAYFIDETISGNHFAQGSVSLDDLSSDFEMTALQFSDDSLISINISSQEIDSDKINDFELGINEFSLSFIDTDLIIASLSIVEDHIIDDTLGVDDFADDAFLFSHLSDILSFDLGGTNQDSYGSEGELIVVSNNQFISESTMVLNQYGLGINTSTHSVRLHIIQDEDDVSALKVMSNDDSTSSVYIQNDYGEWFFGLNEDSNMYIYNNVTDETVFQMDDSGYIGIHGDPGAERLTVYEGVNLGDLTVSDPSEGTIYFSQTDLEFKLVTSSETYAIDSDTTNLSTLGRQSSYLYTKNIDNNSKKSRVLMGDNVALFGGAHIIKGGTQSAIFGKENYISQGNLATVYGELNNLNFGNNQSIFGDRNRVDFGLNSIANGNDNHFSYIRDSHTFGNLNHIQMTQKVRTLGNLNQFMFLIDSEISGDSNNMSLVESSTLNGYGNYSRLIDNVSINGDQNHVQLLDRSVINADSSVVNQSELLTLIGSDHMVFGTTEASIVGNSHFVFQGDGQYFGSNHFHLGSGSPTVIGNHVRLIGHQSHQVNGDHIISLGTSVMDISDDLSHAIVLNAPGGVQIVSDNIVVSYLPSNGGSWAHVSDSNLKFNLTHVDQFEVLDKITHLPLMEWNYKGQTYIQHIGPMAQDFFESFQLGSNDRYIQSVDMDGVILTGIKALGAYSQLLSDKNSGLEDSSEQMVQDVSLIRKDIDQLTHLSGELKGMEKQLNQEMGALYKKEMRQSKLLNQMKDRISRLSNEVKD